MALTLHPPLCQKKISNMLTPSSFDGWQHKWTPPCVPHFSKSVFSACASRQYQAASQRTDSICQLCMFYTLWLQPSEYPHLLVSFVCYVGNIGECFLFFPQYEANYFNFVNFSFLCSSLMFSSGIKSHLRRELHKFGRIGRKCRWGRRNLSQIVRDLSN